MLYEVDQKRPTIGERCFIAPTATLIGDVKVADQVSIWFNVVIRADNDAVIIGSGTNIQDGCVLHVDPDVPLSIGTGVTVGHKVMLHGCTIGDNSLIGMNAVVLNHAQIGENCLIGANALVTEGMQVPDGSLVLGSPAKVIKPVSEAAQQVMRNGAQSYVDKITTYRRSLLPLQDT